MDIEFDDNVEFDVDVNRNTTLDIVMVRIDSSRLSSILDELILDESTSTSTVELMLRLTMNSTFWSNSTSSSRSTFSGRAHERAVAAFGALRILAAARFILRGDARTVGGELPRMPGGFAHLEALAA